MERYIFFIAVSGIFFCMFCSGTRPANIGVKDGFLLPCPDSPNCVSSQAKDSEHYIDPFPIEEDGTKEMEKIIDIIKSMKRTKIIEMEKNYIYAEFKSAIMRFVDDVEFYLDENKKIIHVRSASRIGYSDMSVNRKRIESIRTEFLK